MKLLYQVFSLLILFAMVSCGPTVFFEKPQPRHSFNKNSFSPEFIGRFISEDSTVLVVSDKMVTRSGYITVSRTVNQIQNSGTYLLKGDTLLDQSTHHPVKYNRHNDTIEFHSHIKDTLFVVDHENLLRKYHSHYILNYKISENNWYVKEMSLDTDKSLLLGEFKVPDDVQAFKKMLSVKEITHDEAPARVYEYVLDPSRHKFKKFVDEGGFRNITRFKRLENH